jgi:hypothetical protein
LYRFAASIIDGAMSTPQTLEPSGKGLGEPADPTTEVEGATVRERHRKRLDEARHLFDLLFAGEEEFVSVPLPAALVVVGEIRPERIGLPSASQWRRRRLMFISAVAGPRQLERVQQVEVSRVSARTG